MNAQSALAESPTDVVVRLAQAGRAAQRGLARLDTASKAAALRAAAAALRSAEPAILAANARDMTAAAAAGLSDALLDRLRLDSPRLAAMAASITCPTGSGNAAI